MLLGFAAGIIVLVVVVVLVVAVVVVVVVVVAVVVAAAVVALFPSGQPVRQIANIETIARRIIIFPF